MNSLPSRHAIHDAQSTVTFLGIEGGATRTTAVLLNQDGVVLKRAEAGPSNLRLMKDADLLRLWKALGAAVDGRRASAVGIFLAGCRTPFDRQRTLGLLKQLWPRARRAAGNDAMSAFTAALGEKDGVVLICGSGSIVRARHGARSAQVGGWGHVGGDGGSGYWMGRELVRLIFQRHDETGAGNRLPRAVLRFLGLNTIEEMVQWSLEAPKNEIASLTRVLFRYPSDPSTRAILHRAVELLAGEVALAARKAGLPPSRRTVALNRGLAHHQSLFRKMLIAAIQKKLPGAKVFLSETEGAVGAARLAARAAREFEVRCSMFDVPSDGRQEAERRLRSGLGLRDQPSVLSRGLSTALTEQRNPRTMDLDRRSIPRLVKTMLDEESRTLPAIRRQVRSIARAIEWIVRSLKHGGRLFYLGAGTSGRIGVLDASECPPTFGCDPKQVQGIIAGGLRALHQSIESAEDDAAYGRQTACDRGIGKRDVLVGIAASGSTPFVLGALKEAHHRGAKTILLTFNPHSVFRIPHSNFLRIAIATGPEVVTGSTRLKAGTATKLVLNMFSTIAMIRLGKVRSNLMIDLDPSCEKLHDRAARIYSALKKVSPEEARRRLEKRKWNLHALLR